MGKLTEQKWEVYPQVCSVGARESESWMGQLFSLGTQKGQMTNVFFFNV